MIAKVRREASTLAAQNGLHRVEQLLTHQRYEVTAHTLAPAAHFQPTRIHRPPEQLVKALLRDGLPAQCPQARRRNDFEHPLGCVKASPAKLESLFHQRPALRVVNQTAASVPAIAVEIPQRGFECPLARLDLGGFASSFCMKRGTISEQVGQGIEAN